MVPVLYNSSDMTTQEVRAGFPAEPASAGKARRFVDATLRGWSCEHLVDVASLLVSELVANAVLHAGTTVHVIARITPARLRVEVYDDNPRLPTRKHYSALSTTGRGLMLVERLSEDWGTAGTPSGKVVWFELDQQPSSTPKTAGAFALDELELELEGLTPADLQAPDRDEPGATRGGNGPRLRILIGSRR